MAEILQRILKRSQPRVMSLNVQAERGSLPDRERSQFNILLRHFLQRFLNHDSASQDGDALAHLVHIACVAGLPGFIVAIYLWPVYHPIKGWPVDHPSNGGPPPYWLQVNHHFFFVLYSFVAMGIVTVLKWDLFFPDLLDILVLKPLPVPEKTVFLARIVAIAIFIVGFLFVVNGLAVLALPAAMDPSHLRTLLIAHILSVTMGGLFAASLILALQGLLLAILGERLFRKLSLLLQGLSIAVLLMPLLLFPVVSEVVPVFLQSGSIFARCFSPFWFLGIYQSHLDGTAAIPIFQRLAQSGYIALLLTGGLAILVYPVANSRKVRELVRGPGTRQARSWLAGPLDWLVHATVARTPVGRAVFHFIGQTLWRVPRYRTYLVLYAGVGLSVVIATVFRLTAVQQRVGIEISADGINSAIGIVAFWMIAGLRVAFVSSDNQRGNWIFRVIHGRPPHFRPAMEQLEAAKIRVLLWAGTATLCACLVFRVVAAGELNTWMRTGAQMCIAIAMCLLLTDIFFLKVTTVACTGERIREQPTLAIIALKYFTFFPIVILLPRIFEPWIERSFVHFFILVTAVCAAHFVLRKRHRDIIREHSLQRELEDDEEDFPMKLGLRYN
jgi:hypothetical protein